MAIKKYVFEVIEEAAAAQKTEDKVAILKKFENWALKDVLKGTFDPKIQWELPGGKAPFTASDPHNHPSDLGREHKKFKYFAKGNISKNLTPTKRESIFLGILEGVHPKDAELLVNMINKKKITGLTPKVINTAFPNLI